MTHWEELLEYIEQNPGATTLEIAKAIGVQVGKAYVLGVKLEPYGLIRHETMETDRNNRITRWWSRRVA